MWSPRALIWFRLRKRSSCAYLLRIPLLVDAVPAYFDPVLVLPIVVYRWCFLFFCFCRAENNTQKKKSLMGKKHKKKKEEKKKHEDK